MQNFTQLELLNAFRIWRGEFSISEADADRCGRAVRAVWAGAKDATGGRGRPLAAAARPGRLCPACACYSSRHCHTATAVAMLRQTCANRAAPTLAQAKPAPSPRSKGRRTSVEGGSGRTMPWEEMLEAEREVRCGCGVMRVEGTVEWTARAASPREGRR